MPVQRLKVLSNPTAGLDLLWASNTFRGNSNYSRTPLIRTLVIRIANYPARLDPPGKFVENSTKITCLEITGYWIKYGTVLLLLDFISVVVERFRRWYILSIITAELQTANVAYCQRKIQLSGFSAHPDGSPIQFIRIIGVLPYCQVSQVDGKQIITKRRFPFPHTSSTAFDFLRFFKTKFCTHFSSFPHVYLNPNNI